MIPTLLQVIKQIAIDRGHEVAEYDNSHNNDPSQITILNHEIVHHETHLSITIYTWDPLWKDFCPRDRYNYTIYRINDPDFLDKITKHLFSDTHETNNRSHQPASH